MRLAINTYHLLQRTTQSSYNGSHRRPRDRFDSYHPVASEHTRAAAKKNSVVVLDSRNSCATHRLAQLTHSARKPHIANLTRAGTSAQRTPALKAPREGAYSPQAHHTSMSFQKTQKHSTTTPTTVLSRGACIVPGKGQAKGDALNTHVPTPAYRLQIYTRTVGMKIPLAHLAMRSCATMLASDTRPTTGLKPCML